MKRVAIFNKHYETSYALEKEVNDWIEKYKVKVISIDVKICGDIDYDFFWYATVVYEEN